MFIDQGNSVDIIFRERFDKLGLYNAYLYTYSKELIGFSGGKVHPNRFVTLHLTLGTKPMARTIKMDFLVVDCPSTYNVIQGRPTLNKIKAVISTSLLTMKFITNDGKVRMIKAD